MNEHEPEAVVRKFLEENPHVVENNTQRTLTALSGNHGKDFGEAASRLVSEFTS